MKIELTQLTFNLITLRWEMYLFIMGNNHKQSITSSEAEGILSTCIAKYDIQNIPSDNKVYYIFKS